MTSRTATRPGARAGTPATSAEPGSGPARPWLLSVTVLVVGNFMAVLDITIVNVAVPAIQADFGGSLDDVLWIATAYTLMLGVVVPLSSWLGDRFGLSRVYVLSLAGFAVSSALCGLAWDLSGQVLGTSYANLYLLTALLTVAVAPLACFLRTAGDAGRGD